MWKISKNKIRYLFLLARSIDPVALNFQETDVIPSSGLSKINIAEPVYYRVRILDFPAPSARAFSERNDIWRITLNIHAANHRVSCALTAWEELNCCRAYIVTFACLIPDWPSSQLIFKSSDPNILKTIHVESIEARPQKLRNLIWR